MTAMENPTILEDLAKMISKFSKVKVWDVYCKVRKDLAISAERGAIKTAESISSNGYAVRVFGPAGNIGFAHSNIFTKNAMEKTVNTAVKMLAATSPDPDFQDLPNIPGKTTKGKDFFDVQTQSTTIEEIYEILNQMLERHAPDSQLYSTGGKVGITFGTVALHNSHDISFSEKFTEAGAYFEAIIKEKGEQTSGWWEDSAVGLKQLAPSKIADIAVERAKLSLHHKSITSGEYPVIFTPLAVRSVLIKPLTSAISGENVQYQRTFLSNALGTQIGSEHFYLQDDPFRPRLTGSRRFDDEGVPTKRISIVDKGILKNLLHNSYTAFKAGTVPTGHATRYGVGTIPTIAANNIIMPPGDAATEELIQDVKYGVLFDGTGDSPNLATGDFSGLILSGRLIQKGELGPPLSNTLMGINLKDLFARIDLVGKERLTWGSNVLPHVRISSAKITSGA